MGNFKIDSTSPAKTPHETRIRRAHEFSIRKHFTAPSLK